MLNTEPTPRNPSPDPSQRDVRMTLPARPGEVPREELLGRLSLALAPAIAISGAAFAYALSALLRGPSGVNGWLTVVVALAIGGASAALAQVQNRPVATRYRRSVWVYAALGFGALAMVAAVAAADAGVTSVAFVGVCPMATYAGLVTPQRWRVIPLVGLVIATTAVYLSKPATGLFDAVIVLMLILAAWFVGLLCALGHAHTVKVIRRLASHDRTTGSLSRRGFMQQLEYAVAPQGGPPRGIALLLIKIDEIPGAELDDAALSFYPWIGATVSPMLPDDAEFGRLSDRQFGVLLPDAPRHRAEETARDLRRALEVHGRASAVVGVSVSETRQVAAADLFRVADAASGLAGRDTFGVHALHAGTADLPGWTVAPTDAPVARPDLRYAQIRATGRIPRIVEERTVNRRIISMSLIAVGAAGVPVVARAFIDGDPDVYDGILRITGIPWILSLIGLGVASRLWWKHRGGHFDLAIIVASGVLLGIGLSVGSLARGGLTSPLVGAFFIYVVYGAAILERRRAYLTLGLMLIGWGAVVMLGPPDAMWVVPFHLALFAGCFVLGSVGRSEMDRTAAVARSRSFTDDLTQCPNASGFAARAHAAFVTAATTTGTPFGILTIQLVDLRTYNETRGYGAGDALLRTVAEIIGESLPGHYVVGRTGADEFSAAIPAPSSGAVARFGRDLFDELHELAPVRVGHATCPRDGASVEALLAAARRVSQAADVPRGPATAVGPMMRDAARPGGNAPLPERADSASATA